VHYPSDSLLVCGHVRHPHLPRGSSPSSRRHRTVGAGSPWTSHRKSTVSSSMTTWFTGLRTNTGRSAGEEKSSSMSIVCSVRTQCCCFLLTVYNQLSRIAVPLSNHISAHTHIHAGVALPGLRDRQFTPTDLKNRSDSSRDSSSWCPERRQQTETVHGDHHSLQCTDNPHVDLHLCTNNYLKCIPSLSYTSTIHSEILYFWLYYIYLKTIVTCILHTIL